uniref:Grh/CP2 DB domain-containing protein n=1 Tax=Timema tahoe TaxID=61484 RepID=A0A7R9FJ06_9NEOP|nr:unnamed protein product [Timema tahoe]
MSQFKISEKFPTLECVGEGRMSAWQVDDIPDLDGSLSGLGVDLSGYTMNEGLLALPSLTIFKQEAPSPSSHDNVPTNIELDSNAANKNTQLHHILQHQSGQYGNSVVATILPQQQTQLDNTVSQGVVSSSSSVTNMTISSAATSTTSPGQHNIDCRFQYVLAAATSTATKVNEETLTYLNQGQSYEIKLKKLGELSAYRGKILKSVIRICFHERRLQYMEKEQMAAWQASRPGERILEVDVPLSYGLYDVSQDRHNLNTVKFLWDPTKEVGVYVKVNCISTEFTPKRHGGEKGVTFKIQVETYFNGEDSGKHLHSAACQIKVFKLKGADRKHKQDRERILKRPLCEQDKFQPSYDCTVLNDQDVNLQGKERVQTDSRQKLVENKPRTRGETLGNIGLIGGEITCKEFWKRPKQHVITLPSVDMGCMVERGGMKVEDAEKHTKSVLEEERVLHMALSHVVRLGHEKGDSITFPSPESLDRIQLRSMNLPTDVDSLRGLIEKVFKRREETFNMENTYRQFVTAHVCKLAEEMRLDVVCLQEPYTLRGKVPHMPDAMRKLIPVVKGDTKVGNKPLNDRLQSLRARARITLRRKREFEDGLFQEKRKSWEKYVQVELQRGPWGVSFKIASGKLRSPAMITTLSKNDGSTMTNLEESAVLLMETLLPDDEVTEDTEEHLRLRERMENDGM